MTLIELVNGFGERILVPLAWCQAIGGKPRGWNVRRVLAT